MSDTRLLLGDCFERLRELDDCSIDAVVTDPPYGISFMGKHWDRFDIEQRVGQRDVSKLGVRLSGDLDRPDARKPTARTASAFANAAGEAGDYDLSLGEYGDPRAWPELGGPTGSDNRTHIARGGAMHAGTYEMSPRGMRGFQTWTQTWAAEALRVLKPGGHLLCFASPRTYHRMACGVEEAGFEIRDCLQWLFGSGFPKSRNLDGDYEGWGTALKPGHEPIVLARKPLEGTVAANVTAYGVGALNIDAGRIAMVDVSEYERNHSGDRGHDGTRPLDERGATDLRMGGGSASDLGRWPANVVLDEEAAALLDEQTGDLGRSQGGRIGNAGGGAVANIPTGDFHAGDPGFGDHGGASRFFYCAKVSRAERSAGMPEGEKNDHPTVKPIDLMRWLVRLLTPVGGTLLDPFGGSGSTGCAAELEDVAYVLIEREPAYMRIIEHRTAFWREHGEDGWRIVRERDGAERQRQAIADAGQLDIFAAEDAA